MVLGLCYCKQAAYPLTREILSAILTLHVFEPEMEFRRTARGGASLIKNGELAVANSPAHDSDIHVVGALTSGGLRRRRDRRGPGPCLRHRRHGLRRPHEEAGLR